MTLNLADAESKGTVGVDVAFIQAKIKELEDRIAELEYRLSVLSEHVDWVYEEANK